MIRAAYFAGELVQPCVARQKIPLGGKTTINVGNFFVAVLGADTRDSAGVGNETTDTLVGELEEGDLSCLSSAGVLLEALLGE